MFQLFPNQDDIKTYVPTIHRNMSGITLAPSVNTAVQTYLLPYLGKPFLAVIELWIAANTHADITAAVRDAAAWFAVHLAIPQHRIVLADMGTQQQNDDRGVSSPANEEQVKMALWHALRTGYDKLEYLLWDVLLPQKANPDLSSWVGFVGHRIVCDRILWSPDVFQQYQPLRTPGAMEPWLDLRPVMLDVEDLFLYNILCADLLAEIRTQICDNTLTPENATLLPYIQRYVAAKTVIIANNKNHTRHTGRGAKVTGISDPLNPSTDLAAYDSGEMNYQAVKNIADIAEVRLREFLLSNADNYQAVKNSKCGLGTDTQTSPPPDAAHACGCNCSRCCTTANTPKSLLVI